MQLFISTQVSVLREIRVVKINLLTFQQSTAIASLNLCISYDGYNIHLEWATSSARIKVSFCDRNSPVLCIMQYDTGAGIGWCSIQGVTGGMCETSGECSLC